MKIRSLAALLFVLGLFASPPAFARADTAAATPAAPLPELALVVVETLNRTPSAYDDFDRLDLAFQHVAAQRKWPVKIAAERFAANTPKHDLELRVVHQPIRQEMPGQLVFRAWMTLTDRGTKHDFGIVSFRYYPRPGQQNDDTLEKIFEGAAAAAADKIEPILFPKPAAPKS
jgi:hypothetical protein